MDSVSDACSSAVRFDVLGLGALNVDRIDTQSRSTREPVEDSEVVSTSDEIFARIREHELRVGSFHGGSSFNALLMLGQLQRPRLKLGFLGVGCAAQHGLTESHMSRIADYHVEDLTRPSGGSPGVCCSVPSPHGRKLKTAPEGNLAIVDYLKSDTPRDAVRNARVLHLTSFLEDPELPGSCVVVDAVAEFVDFAKSANPSLVLCLDPGHAWVTGTQRDSLRA